MRKLIITCISILMVIALEASNATAWVGLPPTSKTRADSTSRKESGPLPASKLNIESFDPLGFSQEHHVSQQLLLSSSSPAQSSPSSKAPVIAAVAIAMLTPSVANAATPIQSALGAYGHFVGIIGMTACIVYERFAIKAGMTKEEENSIVLADIGLGVWGLLAFYCGYLRLTSLEKGWDFYSHEPIFWLKIAFVGIFSAATFFNTATLIKRAIANRNLEGEDFVPMSEKLATRMHKICNAEITALLIIPGTATFMARGIGYSNSIPWKAEAALAALIFAGASFYYVKQALTFEEDTPISATAPAADE